MAEQAVVDPSKTRVEQRNGAAPAKVSMIEATAALPVVAAHSAIRRREIWMDRADARKAMVGLPDYSDKP